ncbi:MAG: hypothetical protein J6A01_08460 [Proteobacteria bacterium]|nr:hypothetical protein [Pseudomonadota bacterium]
MKSIKSLVGTLLGGIGILAGLGMLMTGCDEDDKTTDTNAEITQDQLDKCCKTADDYDACVKDYKKNGVCSNNEIPPTDLYGPLYTEYGPIHAEEPTAEEIKECCGEDNGSDKYNECVENYKGSSDSKVCMAHDIDQPDVYGPLPSEIDEPQPTEDEIKECCGDDDESVKYKKCVEELTKSGNCDIHEASDPTYGMPDIPDEQPDA